MISKLHIFGAVAIFTSSVLFGLYLCEQSKKRISEYSAVISLITEIKNNIGRFMTPIDGILSVFSNDRLEKTGFLPHARRYGLADAAASDFLSVSREARSLLIAFSEKLGCGMKEEEMSRCDYYISALTEIYDRERESARENQKLCRFLPPLGALSLIILLL